jgi:biopolymer transport protein ExbD
MGMSSPGSSSAKSEINVTPLVDVCLVLLITFMVMLPQTVPEVSVTIPPDGEPRNSSPTDSLVVSTDQDGVLLLNRKPVTKAQLEDQLRASLARRDRKVVYTDFHAETAYGEAISVLAVLRSAGADTLGIVKKRNEAVPEHLGRAASSVY